MTQPDEIWALVERRAVSSVRGASAEDNDTLTQVALAEAPMNPHRQSAGATASNGPGMMPPMMMGGGGRGGQEGGGSGGLAAGPAVGAGSGVAGPTLVTQPTAPAGSLREAEYTPGGDGGQRVGAMPSGGGAGPGGPDVDDGPGEETEPPEPPAASDSPGDSSDQSEPPAEPPEPRAGRTPRDGFVADPQAVTGMAQGWNDLKTRLGALDRSEAEARLGLVEAAVRPQQRINDLLRMWLEGAVEEAATMESKLRQAVKDYAAVDDDAIADIRRELPRD